MFYVVRTTVSIPGFDCHHARATQAELISKLQDANAGGLHIVRLLSRGFGSYQGQPGWNSMLLSPYAEPLTNAASLTLVAQVS